jgi:hypothetical protein
VDPESQKEYIVNQSIDLGIGDLTSVPDSSKGRLGGKSVSLSQFEEVVKNKLSKIKKSE